MFIEKITDNEKTLIDELRYVGLPDDDILESLSLDNFISCEDFLFFWEEAKTSNAVISSIFKNNLILKKRINVTLENESLTKMEDLRYNNSDFKKLKADILFTLGCYNDLSTPIAQNSADIFENTILEWFHCEFFSPTALLHNKYNGPLIKLNMPDGSIFQLRPGSKIMKTLNYFAKILNEEDMFERIRIRQSQIVNESKISANLCLSIHPLDYITASYNENNWESCMNWLDGDYRRGVIEMMNSRYVIVAYLESEHKKIQYYTKNDTLEWNSKRWREFIIVSSSGIFGIKGYPYWNKHIEKIALQWIRDLCAQEGLFYSQKVTSWTVNENINDTSVNSNFRPIMSCGPAMYNDFYEGNTYQVIVAKNINVSNLFLNYSGESECVICGNIIDDQEDTHALTCDACVKYPHCCYCDDVIKTEDDLWEINGRTYCEYCGSNRLKECDFCDSLLDLREESPDCGLQFVISDEKKPNSVLREEYFNSPVICTVCEYCAEDILTDGKDELFKNHETYIDRWHQYDIIPRQKIRKLNKLVKTMSSNYKINFNFFSEEEKDEMIKEV